MYCMRSSCRSMLVLVGHSLYKLLNKVLYERFMQVHVGPYWTSVDVETETAFSLRPIGPYWTTLGKRSTVGSYILRGAHNTQISAKLWFCFDQTSINFFCGVRELTSVKNCFPALLILLTLKLLLLFQNLAMMQRFRNKYRFQVNQKKSIL